METWVRIYCNNNYEVSDLGRVKSLNYKRMNIEKVLKPREIKNGYLLINLSSNNKHKDYYLHDLVFYSFHKERNKKEDRKNKLQINHINEDKSDNRLYNLNLMTAKENTNWGTGIKRKVEKLSKKILQYDLDDNFIREWTSLTEAGNNGYNVPNINKVLKGKRNSANGYKWKYKEE